ncbi:MAG TPA: hypothetical protein VJZ25_05120, partial [Gemmatimonadaceae bacterium]|nr:hypothetical protein [Gemmatimonadaceae bacterium]
MRTAKRNWRLMLVPALFIAVAALACRDAANPVTAARAAALTPDEPALSQVTFTQEVCGPVPVTLVITENTRLTCDLECAESTGPCIQ